MTKKILFAISVILACLTMFMAVKDGSYQPSPLQQSFSSPVEHMPIVTDDPYAHLAHGGAPIEQRDERFRKWLSVSLKISVSNASGSGTIIYYDSRDGWAYVQSCGHLWNGNMTAEEGRKKNVRCKVITWYQNDAKLASPKEYPAEVLYYSNSRGRDCSLLRFKPDWQPMFMPIAPADFKFQENMRLHSLGCDGGREVAHYDVRYLGIKGGDYPDIVTTENSPRPGRSGGGLMSDDYYIGICWGTSETSGNGNGFFTPLKTLRDLNETNGYGWLNEVGFSWARQIPILDRNNPQGQYPKDYIPLPQQP